MYILPFTKEEDVTRVDLLALSTKYKGEFYETQRERHDII